MMSAESAAFRLENLFLEFIVCVSEGVLADGGKASTSRLWLRSKVASFHKKSAMEKLSLELFLFLVE